MNNTPILPSATSAEPPPIRKRGVVAVILNGERFLVIRRSQFVRAPGMHCFPGGAIEPGETEEQALVRELTEELAVVVRPVRRLWESVTAWQVHLAWWLADLSPGAVILPQPAEVESIHWLTAAELRTLPDLLPSNLDFMDYWERNIQAAAGTPVMALLTETAD